MILWGKTNQGKQRWRCCVCLKTAIRKRNDTRKRNVKRLFVDFILNAEPLRRVAKRKQKHRTTFSRRFKDIWNDNVNYSIPKVNHRPVMVVDGTFLEQGSVLLVVFGVISKQPLFWSFENRENYAGWFRLLSMVQKATLEPVGIVSDGQKGLLKAVRELFPYTPHQRCLAHIIRLSFAWLTKNPKTDVGYELQSLIHSLSYIESVGESQIWITRFHCWYFKYELFLKERSVSVLTGRKWYTHRKLRAVVSLLKHAEASLFHYLMENKIPSTTNVVEGGINAPIKELIQRHRGLLLSQRQKLISYYLASRQQKKQH